MVKRKIYFLITLLLAVILYSQDNILIEGEMQRIKEEFKSGDIGDTPIPQSKLLEELNKPGNEQILEQLRSGNLKYPEGSEFNIEDIKDQLNAGDEDQEAKTEEELQLEEDEKKLKISSVAEMIFDRDLYYESIKEFYGYKIFFNADTENKPRAEIYAPRNLNHIIGPGDSFILILWGDVQLHERLVVTSEGTIHIGNIGVISVHGLTVEELEKKLKKVLSKRYKTVSPDNGSPTTFYDVSFDKLNTLNVFVNGEVVAPGPYELSPNSTIISALIKAGGVTAKGTLRNIRIIRNGKIVKFFDVYDYLQTGKDVLDIMLRSNDNIFVSTRKNTVSLTGEVLNPLKYELKEDETLEDLIKFSGGLLTTASIDKIKVERIVPIEQRKSIVVYSNVFDFDFTKTTNDKVKINPIKLHDRDIVSVYSIPRILTDYISIAGAVYRKGRYSFRQGMKLSDLVAKSGGILADAYTEKIELIRTHPDQTKEYKSLNLENDIGVELQSLDSLRIVSKWDLKSKKVVIISGYIKDPGFEYLSDSTHVSDLIFSRGGILDEWRRNRTYLLHADLTRFNADGVTTRIIPINLEKVLNGDKLEDILLKDGDHLRIYHLSMVYEAGEVQISGYVKNPGIYNLSTNMTIEDIIRKSNGFKDGAYEYKAVVFRMFNSEEEGNIISKVYEKDLVKDFLKTGKKNSDTFIIKDKDHVVIRRDPYYNELRKITITGEVKFQGVYSLTHRNETLSELIERAGGFNSEAFLSGIVFERDSTRILAEFEKIFKGNKKYDIILKSGDNINIPKHPGTVTVEGYVYTPGYIKYRSDWSLDDYIEAAGGMISELESVAGEAVVYYPGGNAKVDDGWFFSPTVKEGSRIFIPKIERLADVEWRTEIRGWVGLATSTLTMVLLLAAIQN